MIFVTVGTQLPFPRLVSAMEDYAEGTEETVIAQVGSGAGEGRHLDCRSSIPPDEFDALFAAARVIVAHAGIGTILSAKRFGRPLVMMPRRHALGEHRNDHQAATARVLEGLPGLYVAWGPEDLPALLSQHRLDGATDGFGPTHANLIEGLSRFVHGEDLGAQPVERDAILRSRAD